MELKRIPYFSLLSIILSLIEVLISFGSTSQLYSGWPFAEHSSTYRAVVIILGVNGLAALGCGTAAVLKEGGRVFQVTALCIAVVAFIFSLAHLAV